MHLSMREKRTIGIIMIDVDNFKKINDMRGHQTGDSVLTFCAQILKNNIRKSDLIGRYGGDEFIVYLPHVKPAHLKSLGTRLRKHILYKNPHPFSVTISLGLASCIIARDPETEIKTLIEKADTSLRKAKQDGRNTVVVFREES